MKPYRKQKLESAIHQMVSEVITQQLQDPRVSPLTTVTRVEVSGDLMVSKVYLSVLGGESEESRTLAAVRHAGGRIRSIVAHELAIRQCPEMQFYLDEGVRTARETLRLIEQNRRALEEKESRTRDTESTDEGSAGPDE